MAELPDGVQHGTPEGYAAGCSRDEKRCPAYWEHGMSCFFAHLRAASDVRYFRAKVRDPRPAAIAARLGFTAPAHRAAEQLHPATNVEAEIVAYQKQKEAREREAAIAKATPRREPLPNRCPECVAGKHGNCDGTAWCRYTDQPTTCNCAHDPEDPFARQEQTETPENTPTTQEQTMPKKTEPTTSPATKPTPPTGSGRTRDELTKIRAWARQNGWEVGTSGRIQKVILDAYEKAMLHSPTAAAAASTTIVHSPTADDTVHTHIALDESTATAAASTTSTDEAAETLAEIAAVDTIPADDALAEEPAPGVEPEVGEYVYADASEKLDETRERVDLPVSEIPTVVGEPAVTGEDAGHAYIPGDDWAQVAISQDVERARDLAVRLEAENANLLAAQATMDGALDFALRSWATADEKLAAERRHMQRLNRVRVGAVRYLLSRLSDARQELADADATIERNGAKLSEADHQIAQLTAEVERLRARRWWQIGGVR